MEVSVRGYYETKHFSITAISEDDVLAKQALITEAEMWEMINWLIEHPSYANTRCRFAEGIVSLDFVYAPTLKAQQIFEMNRYFE